MSPSQQMAGSTLALEHALIMALLLVGLLSIRGEQRRYVPWVVLAGVALSLFTPVHALDFTWPVVSILILPPLLWQMATRMATARAAVAPKVWLAWLLVVLLISLALGVGARVPPASALLLGILAASLVWQIRERAAGSTDLGGFGQLTLALLLAEVDVALHPLGFFLGSLFAGAVSGLLLGYLGVRIAFRFPSTEARNLFCLALAYLAYLGGALMGGSGVVTATMTGLVVAAYGYHVGLWPSVATLPAPLSRWGVFVLLAGVFLLLGWQAHVPLMAPRVLGIGLGLVMAAVGVLAGRWLVPTSQETARPVLRALLRKERKVFLLLLGVLLLWPPGVVLELWSLLVALLAALVTLFILRIMLYPAFNLLGVDIQLPDTGENGNSETV
ncbi:MAG: hypothetical protein Kow0063_22010 [Anaerolineae bacterium]